MLKKSLLYLFSFLFLGQFSLLADEGMWLPLLVEKYNYQKMKEMGLQLTPEQIYSINQACLKDAIVALDRGSCTAELISKDGLLLTNHHCGYGEIQKHSSLAHDYITDGFWAMTREEELTNPGKTCQFLISVEDVTTQVLAAINDNMTEDQRDAVLEALAAKAPKAKAHYEVRIESFYKGNQYFLFIYETFTDIRLVGTPPNAIGKFGADTDNWMWPRHTGDFCIFRIYTAPDGTPATPAQTNVPLHPKYHLTISLDGVNKGDYAMVMGYPGSTTRYMNSWEVDETMKITNPVRAYVRGEKQAIWMDDMTRDHKIFIQYASKYARSSNYWKYSIGQNKGLKALNVVDNKRAIETEVLNWINADKTRVSKYGNPFEILESAVSKRFDLEVANNYMQETIISCEAIRMGRNFLNLKKLLSEAKPDQAKITKKIADIRQTLPEFYKNYSASTDKKTTAKLLKIYYDKVKREYYPTFFAEIEKKYKGDFEKFAEKLFEKSFIVDSIKMNQFLANPTLKVLEKDLAVQAAASAIEIWFSIFNKIEAINAGYSKAERLFVAALMEKNSDKIYAPDANHTMRLTYGTVGNYSPRDAVEYSWYTTLKGYIEKEDTTTEEFIVPKKLKELYFKQDYGRYSSNGEMVTCFTTNNDITGGNSGSPVLNAKGELIGVAFDGNWEAMSGDIAFEPKLQKCICVDIRFVLFVIEKYAGAKLLIDEMTISQNVKQ